MSLPASFLRAAEQHPCFSGCYGPEDSVLVCTNPAQTPAPSVQVSCRDCLSFHVAADVSLLPPHTTADKLARELSDHVRGLRGYAWSVGGYHHACNKIWLSAAYYPCGLFLLDGSRNHDSRTDVEVLIEAFSGGLVQPAHPKMLDPSQYATEELYLDMSVPIQPVRGMSDILNSPQSSPSYKARARRVTVAEFLPMTATVGSGSLPARIYPSGGQPSAVPPPAARSKVAAKPAPRRALRLGEICPVCGARVEERPSLTDTFIGCLC
ncbi:hypothetical protein [Haliangium sp.]|uniref:hypothetical protein n=1 Tax=Haliangium sp. TaxID=2663208 RepID=UPI003D13D0BA